jgi:hypothetical protein
LGEKFLDLTGSWNALPPPGPAVLEHFSLPFPEEEERHDEAIYD